MFSIVYAISSEKRLFSRNGSLPLWKCPEDMAHFKKLTSKIYRPNRPNVLIMGKNTFLSKPPFKKTGDNEAHRIEIVISSADETCNSLDDALNIAKSIDPGKIFLIGGSGLIEEGMLHPRCEEIIESVIDWKNPEPDGSETYLGEVPGTYHVTKVETKERVAFRTYNQYQTCEKNYLDLLKKILNDGETREDRTGTGTISLFGQQVEFDIENSFPLLTTKKINFKSVVTELLWFLRGDTNIKFLKDNGVNFWDGNTSRQFLDGRGLQNYEVGDTGPLYGYQWRNFGGSGVDQIANMLKILKTDPTSRRIFMSAWNPVDLDSMCIPPCHVSFQLYVSRGIYLDGHLYMRSNDTALGLPFNIACYSLLIYIFGHLTGYKPHRLVISFGDVHIYKNVVEQIEEQLSRPLRPLPILKIIDAAKNIDDFNFESFGLSDYDPHPFIKMEMAV